MMPLIGFVATLIWTLGLTIELLLVVAASLLCLFTFNQITPALATVVGFYLLSRSIAAFVAIADSPLVYSASLGQQALFWVIKAIAFLIPDLSVFAPSDWVVYGLVTWADLVPALGQGAIYIGLLCGAALFDLYRKSL